jgi:membrane protein
MSGPLLMLAAISITTSLQSQSLVRWLMETTYLGDLLLFFFRLVPYVSVWLALFFLYIFIPNTKVRFRSALLGGVLAGTIWQLAQWGYLHFQVGVAKYNAIYGTLSLLPVFMVWIYTSWLIVLFGLEIVSAHQNIKTFRREYRTPQLSHAMKELLTLTILQDIATAFHFGCPAPVTEQLAEELDIPVRVVRELVTQLTETGYLVATAGDEPSYQPARELEQISVNEVLLSLKDYGGSWGATGTVREEALMRGILARVNSAAAATLAGMTLKDLVAPSAAR